MTIEEIKQITNPILTKYGVKYAGVFGSVARGEADNNSDVDIFVKFEKAPSLVNFIRLENELKAALRSDVDIVVEGSEKLFIKPYIQKDLVSTYEQR